MLWDVFCRVIDNYGDIGVCWRLAAQLAARGDSVRLWVDDPSPLTWMAPSGAPGVVVSRWAEDTVWQDPGDAVIEAFGCDLPEAFVQRMAHRRASGRDLVWINLEYLSAEPYVSRSHGLPSPQFVGPGAGLRKRFFYPGFTPETGGLLREPDLLHRQSCFDVNAWLGNNGIRKRTEERVISLFCYEGVPLCSLIDALMSEPTLLLVTFGAASRLVTDLLGPNLQAGNLRAQLLPPLSQIDFDHLLWSCDINFVRGEDSLVRALWAGRPFVWNIYPQSDQAHARKLHAFNNLYLADAGPDLVQAYNTLANRWNSLDQGIINLTLGAHWPIHAACRRKQLLRQTDLATQLRAMAMNPG